MSDSVFLQFVTQFIAGLIVIGATGGIVIGVAYALIRFLGSFAGLISVIAFTVLAVKYFGAMG